MSFGQITSTGRISKNEAMSMSTYTNNGWQATLWTTNNNTMYPQLIKGGYTTFVGVRNAQGTITDEQSRMQNTYERNSWEFGKVWGIEEGVQRPFLMKRGGGIESTPSTTRTSLIRVVRDDDGTMLFDGKVYKYVRTLHYTHYVYESMVKKNYFMIGELLGEIDDKRYVLIASDKPLIVDFAESSIVASNDRGTKFDLGYAYIDSYEGIINRSRTQQYRTGITEYAFPKEGGQKWAMLVEDANYDVYNESGLLLYGKNNDFDLINLFDPQYISIEPDKVTSMYYGKGVYDLTNDLKDPLVFIASSVEDPDYPGGYGDYQNLTVRSVGFLKERGNKVNFYYVDMENPDYDYLIKVASQSGNIPIVILKDKPSYLRCRVSDGNIANVSLVPLDDANASPIKVMTPDGIMALQMLTYEEDEGGGVDGGD